MSHKKRSSSRAIQKAATRAAGLETIAPNLDLGAGLSLAAYRAALADAQAKQTAYNGQLSLSDQAGNVLDEGEATLRDLSVRMLAAVAAKYGPDSNEYEKAGGTRRSDRKCPVSRIAAKAPEAVAEAKAA